MTVKKESFIRVIRDQTLYALIIKYNHTEDEGVHFYTPDHFSQQLAYMRHSSGKKIIPHYHNKIARTVIQIQEVLIIKKGKLRVDFFDFEQAFLESHLLEKGDLLFLAAGGHGFEIIEDTEMFEVKQGPYLGESEKTRFSDSSRISMNKELN